MKNVLTTANVIRLARWIIYVICAVLFIALISWFSVPYYLEKTIEQQVATETGRQATVGEIDFNPFTLTLKISDLVLLNTNKKARDIYVAELVLKIAPASLFRLAPVMREVVVKYPFLKLVRKQRDGKEETNFSDVIAQLAAHPRQGEPLRYSISNIQIMGGVIQFNDQVVGKEIRIEAITVGLPFLSNFSQAVDIFIEPNLSATVNGTPFALKGRSKPFSGTRETSLAIDFNHLDLAPLFAFSPKPLPFKVHAAKLTSKFSLNFSTKKDIATLTLMGAASLKDVALLDLAGAPLFKAKEIHANLREANLMTEKWVLSSLAIDELQLSGGTSDITTKKIAIENAVINSALKLALIEKIKLNHVQGDVFRDVDGEINLTHFAKKETHTDKLAKAPTWQAEINQITLSDSHFVFGDKSKKPEVKVIADDVEMELKQVSSKWNHPITMTMRANLNKNAKIAMEGIVAEKSAQFKVDLQNFSVVVLQPYFTDYLNITLEKGAVSTNGQLAWKAPKEINYQGELQLVNFSSSDKETSDSFLRWKKIDLTGIDVVLGTKQPSITLEKIDLSDFYARAILSEKGRLNLEDTLVHQQEGGKTKLGIAVEKKTANPSTPVIKIGKINLNNGVINYTDNFVKPHFSMRMTGMKGTIGAIQSTLAKAAPINLNGKIDNEAPIFISGSLNPLFKPMALDIKMTATGINLPRLTTYSAKYAGYPILKGKLSFDVEYHLKDKQLTAKNSLKIEQLTFGEKVDSPSATKLPVLLAAALLTDSNGRIDLDVPISGTLDDPEFSISGVFFKALMNMIGKVITSPFSLLAHAFSGAEELSYVEFASGSTALTDAAKAKLDNLAKALADRPNLKLDIIGRADLDADTPGLRERKLTRQIKKMNFEEENDKPISDKDKERAIEKIYFSAKFDKPRNMIGLPKSLPVEEMTSKIKENTPISEEDLQALATRRASVVRTYLTDTAHVPLERIYTIAPKISGGDIKDKGVVTRVDFDLKM